MTWARKTWRTIFGNAMAVRDFRVQLRGNKALLIWGFYLAALITIGVFIYNESVFSRTSSIVEAQRNLRNFYQSLIVLLAALVVLIAPALTAGTIVVERQRQSLDLIMSSPSQVGYLLAGKMIASYRYLWMLLILALPVTATCVLLGGAAWKDVFAAFVILSANALVYCAIGLVCSAKAANPVSAIVISYGWVFLSCLMSSSLVGLTSFAIMSGRTDTGPVYAGLNPFFAVQSSTIHTVILGYHVPVWLSTILICLLLTYILLCGAGSVMTPADSVETRRLRIYAPLLVFGFTWITNMGSGMMVSGSMSFWKSGHAIAMAVAFLPIAMFLPNLSCYGNEGGRKYMNDGWFNVKRILTGYRSGSLPYLILLWAAGMAGFGINGLPLGALSFGFWILALAFLVYSFGRFLSRRFTNNVKNLTNARVLTGVLFILIAIAPVPFLSGFQSNYASLLAISLLGGMDPENGEWIAPIHAILFVAVGEFFLRLSERHDPYFDMLKPPVIS